MKVILIAILITLFSTTGALSQKPTAWRGGTNGNYPDKGLLKAWPQNGPDILWVAEGLGDGHSSPVFANGKIFVSTMIDTTGFIIILDLKGKELKRYPYGTEFFESYPGARSTPVIVGDWLYIYSGLGTIYAFDAEKGTLRWKRNMTKEADGENIKWGVTETLVVDGDKIYCTPGGKKFNIVALNRLDGTFVWNSPGVGDLSAYCTPQLIDLGNKKILVTMMANHIVGVDASTGKTLWSHEQPNQWSVHANTPIYANEMIFCTSGYGQGTVALSLSPDGNSVSKAWFNPKFDSRMGGAVYIDGYLYSSGDKNREWRCLDAKTGAEKWASVEIGKGDIISADGLLFLYSEKGELALAEANPNAFKLLSQAKVEKGSAQHWAHPVINDGTLYVRHGNALIAYKIK